MNNPFSWEYLTSPPGSGEIFEPWSIVILVLCAVAMLTGFAFYSRPDILHSRHLMRVASTRRWGSILMWIASIGYFFFVVRWLQINPFGLANRIWLFVTLLALLLSMILIVLQVRAEAPVLNRHRQETQEAIARGLQGRRPPRRSRNRRR
jgi:cobalamin synthase